MKYVIESKSEEGFWNSRIGWVFDITSATRFVKKPTKKRLPISSKSDAKVRVFSYAG